MCVARKKVTGTKMGLGDGGREEVGVGFLLTCFHDAKELHKPSQLLFS